MLNGGFCLLKTLFSTWSITWGYLLWRKCWSKESSNKKIYFSSFLRKLFYVFFFFWVENLWHFLKRISMHYQRSSPPSPCVLLFIENKKLQKLFDKVANFQVFHFSESINKIYDELSLNFEINFFNFNYFA